jgi:GTP-binding protein Era
MARALIVACLASCAAGFAVAPNIGVGSDVAMIQRFSATTTKRVARHAPRMEMELDDEEMPTPPPTPPLPPLASSGMAPVEDEAMAVASDPSAPTHRAGFVSILGVPNVGKSTLMNCLLGEKLSIATSKAQTTRHRIMGIDNGPDYQIVYSDTPGMLRPQYKLQEGMMSFVRSSVVDADVILLVVDIFQRDIAEAFPDEKILRALKGTPAALVILVNKVDLLDEAEPLEPWGATVADGGAGGAVHSTPLPPERAARRAERAAERRAELGPVEEILQRWRDEFPGSTVLPISAARARGVETVLRSVRALLPEHPPYYDKDQLTDKPERFFAAEFLREAIFEHYEQEVPYSCECRIDAFKEDDEIIRIRAIIYVSHESQKGIVIGKKGSALKKVGSKARQRLEDFFQKQVYLETRVKVRPNWRSDLRSLEEFGYV